MPYKEKEVLKRVYEFFSANPEKFTTGSLAKDARGWGIEPRDPKACQWCLTGAIAKFDPRVELKGSAIIDCEWHDIYAKELGSDGNDDDDFLYTLNDTCGFLRVLKSLEEVCANGN